MAGIEIGKYVPFSVKIARLTYTILLKEGRGEMTCIRKIREHRPLRNLLHAVVPSTRGYPIALV